MNFNLRICISVPPGQNVIRRRSTDSNVTVPFDRTFRSLADKPNPGTAAEDAYNYCGCGWPNHMLIPRGAPGGYPTEVFVMISNYDEDRVRA